MSSDDHVAELLRVIQAGDEADDPFDNRMLEQRLGWSADEVAACLEDAKERSLIWGVRGGGRPAPFYADLEVTVQGRRFLAAHPAPAG